MKRPLRFVVVSHFSYQNICCPLQCYIFFSLPEETTYRDSIFVHGSIVKLNFNECIVSEINFSWAQYSSVIVDTQQKKLTITNNPTNNSYIWIYRRFGCLFVECYPQCYKSRGFYEDHYDLFSIQDWKSQRLLSILRKGYQYNYVIFIS